jgi:hypothetical protein
MPTTVLLQYVGYGYEKRGCPAWLARGLRAWRGAGNAPSPAPGGQRLITMFHELYAFGPPWNSSFWASPVQRWIARSVANLSAQCVTNRDASAAWLAAVSRHHKEAIPVLPVVSNLGEPEFVPPLAARKPQMVVYGGLSRSPKDGAVAARAIQEACRRLGIERVVAFGTKAVEPGRVGVSVENTGMLSVAAAGKLLSESRAGYLDYFDGYLGKSGIFAAYSAHGLAPLLLRKNHSEPDGLLTGRHFWAVGELPEDAGLAAQQQIANQACAWYGRHSVRETASIFAPMLKANSSHVESPVEA